MAVGINRDEKREYFVAHMPSSLTLLSGYLYAKDGAAILHENGGLILRLTKPELHTLLESLKGYTQSHQLRVVNNTYEFDDKTPISLTSPNDTVLAMSNTATKFFNTKVHVSTLTDRILTLLLSGLSFNDWMNHVQNGSLGGIPPDVTMQALNHFERQYGKTPDIIRLAVPHRIGNRSGLMDKDTSITAVGSRVEMDIFESDYNDIFVHQKQSQPPDPPQKKLKKLASHGKAVAVAVAVDSYSGYTLTNLLKTTANAEEFIDKFLHHFQNASHTVRHIAADQGVISTTKFDIIPPALRNKLHEKGVTTEVIEPYNHSRGGARVERTIRSIKELVRLAIQLVINNPNLQPLGFTEEQLLRCWGEFTHWATVVHNMKPSRNDKTKSRHEVFLGRKPNMQNVRLLPIGSVILINREPTSTSQTIRHGSMQMYNVPAIYVGPSLATPGAIRAVVANSDKKTVSIYTTSRFTAASDGGGLNVYPHITRALPSLISETNINGTSPDLPVTENRRRTVTFADPPVADATPLPETTEIHGPDPYISSPDADASLQLKTADGHHPTLSNDSPVAEATPTMPHEGPPPSTSVSNPDPPNPIRRSQRSRSPPSRATEEGYLTWLIEDSLSSDPEFPDIQAYFADWATHESDDELYYSFHLHSFVQISSTHDEPPSQSSDAFVEGHKAITIDTPKTFRDALRDPQWGDAARAEMTTLLHTKAIVKVDYSVAMDAIKNQGADLVVLFPVYERKLRDGATVFKVRLVGDGRTHYNAGDCYSATPTREELLILFHLIAHKDWDYAHIDESRAFLNAAYKGAHRAFATIRGGSKENIYEIFGALYGLKSSPKDYQTRVAERFQEMGFQRLQMCSCIYVKRMEADTVIIFAFVDDFIITGTSHSSINATINRFRSETSTTEPLWNAPQILGITVSRDRPRHTISLSIKESILTLNGSTGHDSKKIIEVPLQASAYIVHDEDIANLNHDQQQLLSKNDKLTYMKIVGGLVWISGLRHDILFAVMYLSWFTQAPCQHHLRIARKVVAYLEQTRDSPLILGGTTPIEVVAYSDASLGTATRCRSTCASVIKLGLTSGAVVAKTKTTISTVTSAYEAELEAAASTIKHISRVVNILTELGIQLHKPPIIHVDNMACVQFLQGGNKAKASRHINLKLWFIRDTILKGTISVEHEDGENQPADALTKVVDHAKFNHHMLNIMGHSGPLS